MRTLELPDDLPPVECAHEARPGEGMTPERVASVLLEEEAGRHCEEPLLARTRDRKMPAKTRISPQEILAHRSADRR